MLYLKYVIGDTDTSESQCNVKCSVKKSKSLQARLIRWILQKKDRASCFGSCHGSVTVETALAFPVFLCVLASFIALGQMILIDTEIHHTLEQTAKIYAKQTAVYSISEKGKQQGVQPAGNVGRKIFFSIYDGSSLCENLVEGGARGITVSVSLLSGERVGIKATYILKIPFFRGMRFYRNITVKRRVFSGYVKHWDDDTDSSGSQIVYVAENGVVYHKDASCSHICLKITGENIIQDILHSSRYNACEKCIHKGNHIEVLFVTAYGDCYHATLGCSGLKRTIRAVRLSDIGNMRSCSRCAAANN